MKFSIRKLLVVTTAVACCFAFANLFPLVSRVLIGPTILLLAAVVIENGRFLIWVPAAFLVSFHMFDDSLRGMDGLTSTMLSLGIVFATLTYYSASKTLDQFRRLGGHNEVFYRSLVNSFYGGMYIGLTLYATMTAIWAIEFYFNIASFRFSVAGLIGFPLMGALVGLLAGAPIAVISEIVVAAKTPNGEW